MSSRLREVLERVLLLGNFPRTLVQIVLQAQGSSRASPHQIVVSYLNAASAALLNAGSVPMVGVFCVALVLRDEAGVLTADGGSDESQSVGTFGFVFSDELEQLVWTEWHGALTPSEVKKFLINMAKNKTQTNVC